MYFLGWLAACFLVVGAINLYLRHFGLPKGTGRRGSAKSVTGYSYSLAFPGTSGLLRGSGFPASVGGGGGGGGGESVHWLNSILSWIYQSQSRIPEAVESWLKALTTEAERQSKEMEVRFEGIHGSPPEFSNFRSDASSADKEFTIITALTLRDVTLQVSTVAKSTATRANQVVKCDVYLQSLTGQVKALAKFDNNELSLRLAFASEPNIKLQIRPNRIDCTIDNAAFEKVVRSSICYATMHVDWTSRSTRLTNVSSADQASIKRSPVQNLPTDYQSSGQASMISATKVPPAQPPYRDILHDKGQLEYSVIPGLGQGGQHLSQVQQAGPGQGQQYSGIIRGQQQQPDTIREQSQGQGQYPETLQGQQHQTSIQGRPATGQGQNYPGTVQGQQAVTQNAVLSTDGPKLLIKVVKANGLIDADFENCSAFCRVHIDSPAQDFVTNIIRNSINPHWDEQFLAELDGRTKQAQFEVIDHERQPGSELLGKAVVQLDDIRRMPSSRQIIPLTGKPKSRTSTSGSVTVEFIFKDSVETPSPPSTAESYSQAHGGQKQVRGSFFSTQSGPHATHGAQRNPSSTGNQVNDNFNHRDGVENSTPGGDHSPYSSRAATVAAAAAAAASSQLSAHNLALTSSQTAGSRPHESPTVVVTGADSPRSSTLQPSRTFGPAEATEESKKRESFASTLRRKLGRVKIKPRSQSADRTTSHSLREGSFLMPPSQTGAMQSTTSTSAQQSNRNAGFSDSSASAGDQNGTLRQGRSNSFGSNLRRIFRRDKKDMSRENSLTRPSQAGGGGGGPSGNSSFLGQPTASTEQDRSRRHNTPVPSGDRFPATDATDYRYSSSVPSAASPLQSR